MTKVIAGWELYVFKPADENEKPMKNENQDISKITVERIAEAIKKVSKEYKTSEEVIKKELLDLLADRRPYTDRSAAVINELHVSLPDLWNLEQTYPKRDGVLNLEEIVGKKVEKEINLERDFRKFLEEKNIEIIPIPEKLEDLEKIPRLETLPAEIFKNFVINLAENLEKIPLEVLDVIVPELVECFQLPMKAQIPPETGFKLMGRMGLIVEWHVALRNAAS